jgi:transposase
LSNYNADRRDLFTAEGQAYLAQVPLSAADRFVVDQLLERWQHGEQQMRALDKVVRQFAKQAPPAEREAREALESIPQVGTITIEVVVSELGDVGRFGSLKKVTAFAGLAPGQRSSAGKSRELGISKEGSGLLRWAVVEAAWRLVGHSCRWGRIFDQLRQRRGKKKAIVAVARRLLGVMVSLMRTGGRYRYAA